VKEKHKPAVATLVFPHMNELLGHSIKKSLPTHPCERAGSKKNEPCNQVQQVSLLPGRWIHIDIKMLKEY